jgi:hypothetical protein
MMSEGKPSITWDGSQPIVGPYEVQSRMAVEIMRLSQTGVWVNPDVPVDEAAKKVLEALDSYIKGMVGKAVAAEREACAKIAYDFDPNMERSNYGRVIARSIRERGTE